MRRTVEPHDTPTWQNRATYSFQKEKRMVVVDRALVLVMHNRKKARPIKEPKTSFQPRWRLADKNAIVLAPGLLRDIHRHYLEAVLYWPRWSSLSKYKTQIKPR